VPQNTQVNVASAGRTCPFFSGEGEAGMMTVLVEEGAMAAPWQTFHLSATFTYIWGPSLGLLQVSYK